LDVFGNSYSNYFTYSVCGAGDYFAGDGNFPVFVGEWSNEILYNNSLADRKTNFDTQRYAYNQWGSGSAFWSAKQYGNQKVSGEGIRSDYWCYECMIDEGVITSATTESFC
jgi:glucan 1,3-beta-glucosidase